MEFALCRICLVRGLWVQTHFEMDTCLTVKACWSNGLHRTQLYCRNLLCCNESCGNCLKLWGIIASSKDTRGRAVAYFALDRTVMVLSVNWAAERTAWKPCGFNSLSSNISSAFLPNRLSLCSTALQRQLSCPIAAQAACLERLPIQGARQSGL